MYIYICMHDLFPNSRPSGPTAAAGPEAEKILLAKVRRMLPEGHELGQHHLLGWRADSGLGTCKISKENILKTRSVTPLTVYSWLNLHLKSFEFAVDVGESSTSLNFSGKDLPGFPLRGRSG